VKASLVDVEATRHGRLVLASLLKEPNGIELHEYISIIAIHARQVSKSKDKNREWSHGKGRKDCVNSHPSSRGDELSSQREESWKFPRREGGIQYGNRNVE